MATNVKEGALSVIYDPTRTQVLLVQRQDVPVWVLPGGGIDEGETPENAVCREVLEETGLQVEIVRKVAEYLPTNSLTKSAHFFECKMVGGSLISATSETRACGFHPLTDLPRDFFFIHKDFLKDALSGNAPQRKKLNQVSYWNLTKYFFRHPWRVLRFGYTYLVK